MTRYMVLILFVILISSAMAQSIKPNVVLILTDDQGWGDLSLHGNPWLETPHLDNMARDGARLNNFYVSPLCSPTRASLLTGRNHLRTGVMSISRGLEVLDADETTLAELFKANGYTTGIFGKWHNGQHYPNRPNDQGFDEFLGFCAGHWSNYFNTTLEHNGTLVKTQGFIADVLTDAALQFIESNRYNRFFCYIPFNTPHSPHQVPDKYFDKYKAKGLDNELACVYGMVENIDDNVGRILSCLKQRGLEKNTIIVFLSDNGPNGIRYNGNMKGIKGSVHEGGVRVPCFIMWKDTIRPGTIIQSLSAHIDIYPTLLDLCQLTPAPAKTIDGLSLAPLIVEGEESVAVDRNIFTHVNFMDLPITPNSGGFRNKQYRFVFEKGKPQLYDLLQDPGEGKDVSQDKSEQTKRFLQEYQQWFAQSIEGVHYERPIVLTTKGVELPVYEAHVSAGMTFKEGHGWAHDWVDKWNGTKDSLFWEIDCHKAGSYSIEMDYLCKTSDIGSTIECSIGKEKREVTITQASFSRQVPSPDRVPRKEAYEMDGWKSLRIGTFAISEGKHSVRMRALKIEHRNVAEIRGLRLRFAKE